MRLIIKVYIICGHQSQTIERIKAFIYDIYKFMSINFWEKGAWNFTKKYFEFLSIPSHK